MTRRIDMAKEAVSPIRASLLEAWRCRRELGDTRQRYALVEAYTDGTARAWWRPASEAQPRFQGRLNRYRIVALVTWPEYPCRGQVAVTVSTLRPQGRAEP